MSSASRSRLGNEGRRDDADTLGPSSSQSANKRRKLDGSLAWPTSTSQENAATTSATITTTSPALSCPSALQATAPSSQVMLSGRSLPLLVCSIGNPGPHYADTLHSAGHTLLNHLAVRLGYASFHKERALGNGLVSYPLSAGGIATSTTTSATGSGNNCSISNCGDWTLWQSPSYMNESGKSVRSAYAAWAHNLADSSNGKLVIIHDELEKPLGAVTLRTAQGASAKGHNGLKSIMSLMGSTPFARIGVGIGRPVSRQSDDVARYVLKKMDPAQLSAIEGAVDQVIVKLRELERE